MAGRRGSGAVPRGVVVAALVVLALIVLLVAVKLFADRSAEQQVSTRADQVREMLDGSDPEDFLAFNAGRRAEGSVAATVADQPDFVSVDARAERALIRFQPEGWWQGFTERCVVAVVSSDEVVVDTPKTACVRVDPTSY